MTSFSLRMVKHCCSDSSYRYTVDLTDKTVSLWSSSKKRKSLSEISIGEQKIYIFTDNYA